MRLFQNTYTMGSQVGSIQSQVGARRMEDPQGSLENKK